MKSKTLTYITAMTVATAQPTSIRLVAQDQEEHHKKHTHYLVKDLGTLGGNAGVAEGISDTGWGGGDENLAGDTSGHAFLPRVGVMTYFGTLGGMNSQEQWPVKDSRGLSVGSAETSAM